MPPLDTKNSNNPQSVFSNNLTNQPNIQTQRDTNVQTSNPNSEIRRGILLGENLYKKEIDPVFQSKSSLKPTASNFSKISPGVYSVLKNQEYIPTPTTTNQAPPATTNIFSKNIPTTPAVKPIIRTFRSDVESAIKVDHWSSVNIAMAENERMRVQEKIKVLEETKSSNKKTGIIIIVSVLFVLFGVGIFVVPSLIKNTPTTTSVTVKSYGIITPEYTQEINIDNIQQASFAKSLGEKIKSLNPMINTVQELYFTKGQNLNKMLFTSAELVSWGNLNMPDQLVRALNPEYMIGVYSYGTNLPFLIFKTSSFENTFAGMITWEANMKSGLSTIFSLPQTEQTINEKIGQDKFIDMIIQNKDVRVLKNSTGQIILLYSIIDKTTVVITTNEQSFKEILSRLNREKSLAR